MTRPISISRRQVLRTAAVVAAMPLAGVIGSSDAAEAQRPGTRAPGDGWRGLKFGVATYTFRKFKVEETIKGIRRAGLRYCSIKDFHLPMNSASEQRKEVGKQFRDGGVTPLSCGVVGLKNDEANVRNAFEYTRDLGVPVIVCAPEPAALPLLDKFVKEFDIKLALHNHGPDSKIFRTPDEIFEAIKDYDQRIGLCVDVGHTARDGVDPAASIRKCAARVHDVHMKDISAAEKKGGCVESGRGVLDLKSIMRAILDIRFTGLIGFEYEKDADDPVPGLAESAGYMHGLLMGMD